MRIVKRILIQILAILIVIVLTAFLVLCSWMAFSNSGIG